MGSGLAVPKVVLGHSLWLFPCGQASTFTICSTLALPTCFILSRLPNLSSPRPSVACLALGFRRIIQWIWVRWGDLEDKALQVCLFVCV